MKLSEFFEGFEPKTDKGTGHSYIQEYYCKEFSDKREKELKILEIGVSRGYSLVLWSNYFKNVWLYGVENNASGHDYSDIIWKTDAIVFEKDAYNKEFVNTLENEMFDYIIDDGPHSLKSQLQFIDLYMDKIKVGGKLIIEDIQGMGYANELIDYCKKLNLDYKFFDLRSVKDREDDLLIEITKK